MEAKNEQATRNELAVKILCLTFAGALLAMGFYMETPAGIARGLYAYITSRAVLVSDYFVIGSIGAAFVNAGLVMLLSIALTLLIKSPYNGNLVAALFLMPGFALFGKNPVNILPFFLGVFLYARFQKEPMGKFTAAALYSTTLAPIVSDLMFLPNFTPFVSMLIAWGVGTLIGFIIVPIAQQLFQMHRGYNLFNYGFACGILAYIFTCTARARHLPVTTETYWYAGVESNVLAFVLLLCAALVATGLILTKWSLRGYRDVFRYHGHTTVDEIDSHSIGVATLNMGVVGFICTGYIMLIGGDLSGPIVGAIFTAIGFAALGVHPLNLLPIIFGVWLASYPDATSHATNPTIQMAALFGATALAPIAGEYGPFVGILAGVLHFQLVYTTGGSTGGFNLYNNGFAAGIGASVLVTLIHAFLPRFHIVTQRKIMRVMLLRSSGRLNKVWGHMRPINDAPNTEEEKKGRASKAAQAEAPVENDACATEPPLHDALPQEE